MKRIKQTITRVVVLVLMVSSLSAQSDKVGINTMTPKAQLHVVGDSVIFETTEHQHQLVFSLDSIGPVLRSLQNVVLSTDSTKQVYINPDGHGGFTVGTYLTNPNAVVTIAADDRGILLPRLIQDSINAMPMSMDDEGLLVYNSTTGAFNVFSSGSWQELQMGSGGGFWTENASGEAYRLSNVGIGTDDPAEQLDVYGDIVFRGDRIDSRAPGSNVNRFSIVKGGLHYYMGNSLNEGDFYIQTDRDFHFRTDDSGLDTRMTLKRNGRLGINTLDPDTDLHIVGNPIPTITLESQLGTELEVFSGSGGAGIKTDLDHDLSFSTNGLNRLTIEDDGDVGIGVTNPEQRLAVQGAIELGNTNTDTEGTIRYNPGTDDFEGYDGIAWKSLTDNEDGDTNAQNEIQQLSINGNVLSITGGNNVTIPTSGGGGSSLWTDNGSQDIYYNAGKVGIGTPTPSSDLHIDRTTNLANDEVLLNIETTSASSSGSYLIEAKRGTTPEFSVESDGDTYIGGNLTVSSTTRNWAKIDGFSSSNLGQSTSRGLFYLDDGSSQVDYPSIEMIARNETGVAAEDYTCLLLRPSGNTVDTAISLVWSSKQSNHNTALKLYNTQINQEVVVLKEADDGRVEVYDQFGDKGVELSGIDGLIVFDGKTIEMKDQWDTQMALIQSRQSIDEGARIDLLGMTGDPSASNGVKNNFVVECNDATNEGAHMYLRNYQGEKGIEFYTNYDDSSSGTSEGAYMYLRNPQGQKKIEFYSNYKDGPDARIITDELEIKGGSDFAEHFDIIEEEALTPVPGMVVSIDPASTGMLEVTKTAYDRKVAGIISGANGVETGLMMGQRGSIADGDYPVALSGRVYVYANDEGGNIQPGDLLTTSSTAGYAMKVQDCSKAQGAIIGKAMTTIDENGFVLVLVNLQ